MSSIFAALKDAFADAFSKTIFSALLKLTSPSALLRRLLLEYRHTNARLHAVEGVLKYYDDDADKILRQLDDKRTVQLSTPEQQELLQKARAIISAYRHRSSTFTLKQQHLLAEQRGTFDEWIGKNESFLRFDEAIKSNPELEKKLMTHLLKLLADCEIENKSLLLAAGATGGRRVDQSDPEQDPDADVAVLSSDSAEAQEMDDHASFGSPREDSDAATALPGSSSSHPPLSATPSPDQLTRGPSDASENLTVLSANVPLSPAPTARRSSWNSLARESAESENNYWLLEQLKLNERESRQRDLMILTAVESIFTELKKDLQAQPSHRHSAFSTGPDLAEHATPSRSMSPSAQESDAGAQAFLLSVPISQFATEIRADLQRASTGVVASSYGHKYRNVDSDAIKNAVSNLKDWEDLARRCVQVTDQFPPKWQDTVLDSNSSTILAALQMLLTVLAQVRIVIRISRGDSAILMDCTAMFPVTIDIDEERLHPSMRTGFFRIYGASGSLLSMPKVKPFHLESLSQHFLSASHLLARHRLLLTSSSHDIPAKLFLQESVVHNLGLSSNV